MLDDKGHPENFNLTADDLFTLDLAPLTTVSPDVPEAVTIEEILQELEATPSATLEEVPPSVTPEVSPTLTPTPLE
jgi:hypothetical protein